MGALIYLMVVGTKSLLVFLKWAIIVEFAMCVALGWFFYAMIVAMTAAFRRTSPRITPLSRALRSAGIRL